jgi:hypothetical protein
VPQRCHERSVDYERELPFCSKIKEKVMRKALVRNPEKALSLKAVDIGTGAGLLGGASLVGPG